MSGSQVSVPGAAAAGEAQADGRPEVRWVARAPAPPTLIEALVRRLGVPPLVASLLWTRGIGRGDVQASLAPNLEPSTIPALDEAAAVLDRSIRQGRRILVHGDYDADGITGTAVLTLGLRALGGHVEAFLPNRLTHGYGVHPDLVDDHAAACDLFITVDCGIGNTSEVARLRRAGVEVIVTDHHTPGDSLPDAVVVHPRHAPGAAPGVPELTGAGVAYHLLWRLHERLGLEPPLPYADIAAIGTIADVAPLLGANRALVREGLARLADSAWPGVRALLAASRIRGEVTARDVAFGLAPRLNAAGRLGEPEVGFELLTTANEHRARELAVYLGARNDERKGIQQAMFEEASERVDPAAPAIVIGDDGWHPGVMGIVASKLLERFYRPVFIMAKGQGSVRSTPGISAIGALRAAGDDLLRYGGHLAAAGFKIDPGRVASFRDRIHAYVGSHPEPVPEIVVDAVLGTDQVDDDLWRALCSLEPFGEGHAAPLFALCDTLHSARAVGRSSQHLQLRLSSVKGVAWRQGELAASLRPGTVVQAAAALRENVWNDVRALEFVAEGVRPATPLRLMLEPGADGSENAAVPLAPATAGEPAAFEPEHARHAPASAHRRVRRGRPSDVGEGYLVEVLPLDVEPLRAAAPLGELLRSNRLVWFDLNHDAQADVTLAARRYPTVHDVRRAFVAIRAGRAPNIGGASESLLRAILVELDLLDARGLPRAKVRRDPFGSDTLVAGLMQRYRLETFLSAYRHLDEEGFARTVTTLFDDAASDRVPAQPFLTTS